VLEAAHAYSVALRLLSEQAATRPASWGVCMAWRTGALRVAVGEFERQGGATFVWAPWSRAPTSVCGPSRRRKLVVRTSGRRRRLLVRASSRRRGGMFSCEAESCRASRKLAMRAAC
jgi:hypothetical protein